VLLSRSRPGVVELVEPLLLSEPDVEPEPLPLEPL
jgi:hypothetical protein